MGKVWIVAPFANIAKVGERNRFQYLANRLHKEGMDVTLFTSKFNHGTKKHISNNLVTKYPYKVKLIDESGYKKNVSIKRVLSHLKFAYNLRKQIKTLKSPDIVYSAYPTISASYIAGQYAQRSKIPFIIDIQDIWPESISAAIDTTNPMVKVLMWPFTKIANRIYRMADLVIGVSATYVNRAKVKGTKSKKFIPVYIGTELKKFNSAECGEYNIKKSEDDIWITYIGTLSHSYDIETAIKTFAELKKYKSLKLNILGSGPDENALIKLAQKLNVYQENVFFHGYMQYTNMVAFLKQTDIALNALTAGSKGTITNKLGDYISAGLPILNSCREKEVLNLINNNKLGVNYTPGDMLSLKNAIENILEDGAKIREYSKNSRALAKIYFDRENSYKVISDEIRGLMQNK